MKKKTKKKKKKNNNNNNFRVGKKKIYCSLKERECTLTNNSYVGER